MHREEAFRAKLVSTQSAQADPQKPHIDSVFGCAPQALKVMSTKVKIVEQYYDYRPPVRVYGSVEVLLRYVPEEYLEGLGTITITNSEYMRKALKGKFTQEKRRFRAADCRGMYWGRQIWLILDQICNHDLFMIIPPVRTIFIGEVLYHEIGHHVHAMEQPGFRKDKEAFANECRDKLMTAFMRQRYWYLVGVLKLFKPLLRRLYSKTQRSPSEA